MIEEDMEKLPYFDKWGNLIASFFPNIQDAVKKGNKEHKTLHAVIVAAVRKNRAERLGTSPNKPRIHRDELLRPRKHWRDLANHPQGDRFRDNAGREIGRMSAKRSLKTNQAL